MISILFPIPDWGFSVKQTGVHIPMVIMVFHPSLKTDSILSTWYVLSPVLLKLGLV